VTETDHVSFGLLSHKAAERDNWRDAGKKEKDRRSQTLNVDAVFYHTGVHLGVVAVLHVVDHTAEKPVGVQQQQQQQLQKCTDGTNLRRDVMSVCVLVHMVVDYTKNRYIAVLHLAMNNDNNIKNYYFMKCIGEVKIERRKMTRCHRVL